MINILTTLPDIYLSTFVEVVYLLIYYSHAKYNTEYTLLLCVCIIKVLTL